MKNYDVCAYYFPNYHKDKRNLLVHGKDWDEWELVKKAVPRFDGHLLPNVPLWGYEDLISNVTKKKNMAISKSFIQ